MNRDCKFCNPPPSTVLMELPHGLLMIPKVPHIAPEEGGHLVVAPRAHVPDRRALAPGAMLTVDLLTMIAADTLAAIFGAEWQNYQENGNWQRTPEAGHAHVHVYGRRRDAVEQPFGEALRFPQRDQRETWKVRCPDPDEENSLRTYARDRRSRYAAFERAIATS